MTIPGLKLIIEKGRKLASDLAQRAQAELNPREAHEIGLSADTKAKEMDLLKVQMDDIRQVIEHIETLITHLISSTHQTRGRALARTALEQASGALQRECGVTIHSL